MGSSCRTLDRSKWSERRNHENVEISARYRGFPRLAASRLRPWRRRTRRRRGRCTRWWRGCRATGGRRSRFPPRGQRAAARPAAPSAAFDRTPSMSRSAPPAAQRPAAAASPAQRPAQPAAAQRPANNIANRPAAGGGNTPGGLQPGNSIANRPAVGSGNSNSGQRPIASQPAARPSQNQLSGFLNLPQQSAAGRPAPPAPSQLPASGRAAIRSRLPPRVVRRSRPAAARAPSRPPAAQPSAARLAESRLKAPTATRMSRPAAWVERPTAPTRPSVAAA